jgi:ACR3 family arsenite efflux pump ArsB
MNIGNVSLPVAVLLLWIMYPVLAGVRYRTGSRCTPPPRRCTGKPYR